MSEATFYGALLGGGLSLAGSLIVATIFHLLATRDLDKRTERLERLIDILGKVLEDPDRTSIRRDKETNRIIGNVYDETHRA